MARPSALVLAVAFLAASAAPTAAAVTPRVRAPNVDGQELGVAYSRGSLLRLGIGHTHGNAGSFLLTPLVLRCRARR